MRLPIVSVTDQFKSVPVSIIDIVCTSVRTASRVKQSRDRKEKRFQSPQLFVNYWQGKRNSVVWKEKHHLRSRGRDGWTVFHPRGKGATQRCVGSWEGSDTGHFERRRLLWRRRLGWPVHTHVICDSTNGLRPAAC